MRSSGASANDRPTMSNQKGAAVAEITMAVTPENAQKAGESPRSPTRKADRNEEENIEDNNNGEDLTEEVSRGETVSPPKKKKKKKDHDKKKEKTKKTKSKGEGKTKEGTKKKEKGHGVRWS